MTTISIITDDERELELIAEMKAKMLVDGYFSGHLNTMTTAASSEQLITEMRDIEDKFRILNDVYMSQMQAYVTAVRTLKEEMRERYQASIRSPIMDSEEGGLLPFSTTRLSREKLLCEMREKNNAQEVDLREKAKQLEALRVQHNGLWEKLCKLK